VSDTRYIRLTRLRRRRGRILEAIGAYSSLWLGSDHLLSITSNRFAEDYKRFYFGDIQAIAVVRTGRRRTWNFVSANMAILGFLLSVILLPVNLSLLAFFFVGIPIVILVFNNLLGPTCTVYLQTAVQVEELSSLTRMRRAQKVMDRIRPRIIAAQGSLDSEEIALRLQTTFPAHRASATTSPLNLS